MAPFARSRVTLSLMERPVILKLTAGVAAIAASLAAVFASQAARPGDARPVRVEVPASPERPVFVELYQSQGCSSCPPANANFNAIADRPNVVALSFAVTYWDALGWKDTFASPEFTERQWDYARHNRRGNVATPQVWINGRKTIVGSNRGQLGAAMTDDLDAAIAKLAGKGVQCGEPFRASWGRATSVPLPGGGKIGLYEPHHARP